MKVKSPASYRRSNTEVENAFPAANLIWVEGRAGIMTVLPQTVRACVRFKAEKTEEILKVLQEIKDN